MKLLKIAAPKNAEVTLKTQTSNIKKSIDCFSAIRIALLLLTFFGIFTFEMNAQNSNDKNFNEAFQKFKIFYEQEIKQNGIVGSSFIFLKDNKILARNFYGSANLEKNQRTDENTIYHWASNTKPLTGIAIMQLRDRGLLKLDDPVVKYLPELRKVRNPFGDIGENTIKDLMNHSAGFRNSTFPYKKGADWEPFEPTEYAQVEAMLPFTEILFKPGTKFSYSNLGIVFFGTNY